jgi:dolichol-phosphate mannosyltransferase
MNHLSVVIPVYNEQENVAHLAEEIERTFKNVDFKWEVIWVDDFSSDLTVYLLQTYALEKSNHKIIMLPERCGQSAAVLNGIKNCSYSLIGTLDGDGQNCPADLLILKKILEESNVVLVQGFRKSRKDVPLRLVSTNLANIIRRKVLNDHLKDVGCAVRIFQKDSLTGLPAFRGWHRFFPVLISKLDAKKVLEHPVSHRERWGGTSKYGVWNRLWVGLFDLIGMVWFQKRKIKLYTSGEVQWKNSSMVLDSQDNFFLPEEFLSSGLQVKGRMNQ